MKRVAIISLLITLSLLLVVACGGGEEAPPELAGDAARGEMLFNSGGTSGIPCTTCHTLDGTTLVGPSLEGISERAGERVEGLSAEEYIHQSIVAPSSYIVDGFSDSMNKTYPDTLSEEDIDDLIAFLLAH